MKKTKTLIAASLALLCSTVNAGGMGEEPMIFNNAIVPFLALEGGYTWNQQKNFSLSTVNNAVHSRRKLNGWSTRLVGGMFIPYCDTVSFSSELGYGYYGETRFPVRTPGLVLGTPFTFNMRSKIDGMDVLAGVYYRPGGYDLFLKGGGLVTNTHVKTEASIGSLALGPLSGDLSIDRTRTQVMPVVKLGGGLSFTNNLSFYVAWTHAFGATPSLRASFGAAGTTTTLIANLNTPTMDIVMLGAQYNFA